MTDTSRARDQVVAACRRVADRGLSPGSSGSLSVRCDDVVLMTPTGSSCSRVAPPELAVVPLSGTPDEHGTEPRPSKEWELHQAIYRVRRDVHAVVHLHSHYTVAAACLEPWPADSESTGPLPALTPYQVMRLGTLPTVPYFRPGSSALARAVADVAGEQSVMLLANHGSVVAAADLDRAVDLAEELEAAARLTFTLAQVPHRRLAADQVAELRS